MNSLAHIVLIAWLPLSIVVFAALRTRNAVLWTNVVGLLFLPVMTLDLPGFIDYGKMEAISISMLVGVLLFDRQRLAGLRPQLDDIPLVMYALSAPLASLVNGHSSYDAMSAFAYRSLQWVIPYSIGAAYLRSRADLRATLWAVFLGGLSYVPLCLIEMRISPQLHRLVYGEHQHTFNQTLRGGGYRPTVFMDHGLMLSLYMAAAALAGLALWRLLGVRRVAGAPMSSLACVLTGTFVLCKSAGALLTACAALVMASNRFGKWLRRAFLVAVPAFIAARIMFPGVLEGTMVDLAQLISDERAGSLQYRFDNERYMLERFWDSPMFGLSPWGFNTAVDTTSGAAFILTTDSLWIITLAQNGLLGITGLIGCLWMATARGLGFSLRGWRAVEPELLVCGLIVLLVLTDILFNDFVPPIYPAIVGGLTRAARSATDRRAPERQDSEARRGIRLRPRPQVDSPRATAEG